MRKLHRTILALIAITFLLVQITIAQTGSGDGFVFNTYSFLLGLISVLLTVIGFLTRAAYAEMHKGIAATNALLAKMNSKVNRVDRRLIRVEVKLGIDPTLDPEEKDSGI